MYAFTPHGENSWLMRVVVSKTTFRLEKKWHTSWPRCGMLSKHRAPWKVGFWVQYKGNPSRRVWSLLLQRTFRNLPLKPLYDCWKSDNNALPTTPLKETTIGDPNAWPQRNTRRLPHMEKGQSVCKEWKNPKQMPSYLNVASLGRCWFQ